MRTRSHGMSLKQRAKATKEGGYGADKNICDASEMPSKCRRFPTNHTAELCLVPRRLTTFQFFSLRQYDSKHTSTMYL